MTEKTLHLKKSDLTGFEELLLITGSDPMKFLYVGYRPDTGFEGGLLENPKRDPLADCAAEIDRAAAKGAAPAFRPIKDGLPYSILRKFIGTPPFWFEADYAPEQIAAIPRMVLDKMPERALSYLNRSILQITDYNKVGFVDILNFLSCGDREARLQALCALPLHAEKIIKNPSFRDHVDRRAPLSPLVAEHGDLAPAEMRRYAKIEAQMSVILNRAMKGEAPLTREPAIKPGNLAFFYEPILKDDVPNVRKFALEAAKRLRADQVPATPEDMLDMLTYVSEMDRLRSALGLGDGPFQRHMSRVSQAAAKEGVWGGACLSLREKFPEWEISDYMRSLSTALVTGLLISRLRDRPEVEFDRFGRAAQVLREKRDPDPADAAPLGAYLRELSHGSNLLNSVKEKMKRLIREGQTIKSLHAKQVRWHHIRHTLENKVMRSREPLAWAPLLGEIDLDGVRAVELTSSEALDRQGRLERHCVGGYTATVMGATSERASLIFSLEKGERILSTIEMVVTQNLSDKKEISCRISQNRAAGNAEPDDLALRAGMRLREALDDLPKQRVREYLMGLRTNQTTLRDQLASATTRCGGDVVNPGLPERVLETYAEVLPKTLRGLDPDGLLGELIRVAGAEVSGWVDDITDRIVKALPKPEAEKDAPDQTVLQMAS